MGKSFLKFMRGEKSLAIIKHPKEFALFALAAYRARRTDALNDMGLESGEAMIGDYQSCGLTRQEYRTALKNLKKWNFLTTKATNKGTIAKLINSDIFDINIDEDNQQPNQRPTSSQPTANQQPTTNKKEEEYKERNNDEEVALPPSASPAGADGASLSEKSIISLYHKILPELPAVQFISDSLKVTIRERIKEDPQRQTLEWWQWYFQGISECDYLMGRVKNWKASFVWLTDSEKMTRVLNGQYLNHSKQQAAVDAFLNRHQEDQAVEPETKVEPVSFSEEDTSLFHPDGTVNFAASRVKIFNKRGKANAGNNGPGDPAGHPEVSGPDQHSDVEAGRATI